MRWTILVSLAMAGCAHDVTAVYGGGAPSSGTIEVVLNEPTDALTVAINDQLVVDRAHSRRAQVVGVPAGPVHVHVATGKGCEQGKLVDRDMMLAPGGRATLALPHPEISLGCAVWSGLQYIGLNIGILAIAVVLVAAVP
jgi:hypothetical protein